MVNKCVLCCIFAVEEEKNVHPCLFFFPMRSPKDSTDEFNLGKTDLNVFLLPSTVCGHQHRLQEPEERWP